jgi:hypothetical protein
VRDLDAHSWVEVNFTGIGWVTFDPTPAAAPADRPGAGSDAATNGARDAGGLTSDSGESPGAERPDRPSAAASDDEGGGLSRVTLVGLALLAAALTAGAVSLRRRRRLVGPAAAADASLHELQRALPRLGWELGPGTTLLELEQRLGRMAGPRAAGYVSRLRAGRFGHSRSAAPDAADRRALRRELTAGRGLRVRLRGFRALPPGRRFTGS